MLTDVFPESEDEILAEILNRRALGTARPFKGWLKDMKPLAMLPEPLEMDTRAGTGRDHDYRVNFEVSLVLHSSQTPYFVS